MASFVENRLVPFTPYVDQLPIDAMVTVGRQKQAQYDQGVQKIQTQIDNIAGMDVVRDVDKQYLQSKLNELGGNLRKVAAGDFSNYQLQNSVGGMITKIGKDSNIQNAVGSTVRYKKGLSDMEAAKKEGKSSPSNEWAFTTEAANWLNSTNIKQPFSGSYNPYTNYKKNALEAIKALTKDESITDDAFTVDSKGNLVIVDATVRKKFAGISPDKIQQALMANLTPSDFKQMEIDGRYNYSNVNPQRFIQDLNSSYTEKISFYNQQKKILENAKSSTTSNLEKTKLNDQIASLDKVIGNISTEFRGMNELAASGNIEAVKAQLHTNNFIDNFSKAFSYTETSDTYQTSPLAQMAMQRANKEQDWKKFILGMQWDKEKFAINYAQEERKISQKEKEINGLVGGVLRGIPQENLPEVTLQRVIEDTEKERIQIENDVNGFIKQQGKDLDWYNAQKKAWYERPKSIDSEVKNHFKNIADRERNLEANMAMVSEIRNKAEEQFGRIEDFIPENAPNVNFKEGNVEYTFTPQDFVNYNENYRKYLKFTSDKNAPVTIDYEKAQRELPEKQLFLLESLTKNNPTQGERELGKIIYNYQETVNDPFRKTLKEINKFTAEEVAKRVTQSQGVSYGIPTGNEAEKSALGTLLSQFADKAEKDLGSGIAKSSDFDVDTARELAVKGSTRYSIQVIEGTEYQDPLYIVNVTGDDKKTTQFTITEQEKLAALGTKYEASPATRAFRPYQRQITKMGGYTTSLSGTTSNPNTAYLNSTDFPSVGIYGVKADITQPQKGQYSIRLNVYDPITQKWYDNLDLATELLREDQVIPMIRSLNDAAVYELLNETSPTAEDLKRLQQASKKPL